MIFIGDVHGKFATLNFKLKTFIKDNKIQKHNFIQIGDFGLFCDDDLNHLYDIDDTLIASGNNMYVIRGNHDNPKYWTDEYTSQFSNIFFMKDNSFLKLDGLNVLFIGGSISIDRMLRKEGVNYWKNETQTQLEDYEKFKNFDIVVSHNASSALTGRTISQPVSKMMKKDPMLKQDIKNENHFLEAVYSQVLPKYWIYGHHHEYKSNIVDDYTRFVCLAELDFFALDIPSDK